jgi:hypothetical protein
MALEGVRNGATLALMTEAKLLSERLDLRCRREALVVASARSGSGPLPGLTYGTDLHLIRSIPR